MHYTLLELNTMVRDTIETELADDYWVQAELAECRENRGHCYMELVQKEDNGNTPIARASAKCWKNTWAMARPYFERETGQVLHAGMKVLLKVHAQFHEAYGFSWIVTDIDPTYTLGDLARRRQQIIAQLKKEGVFDLQRELQFPLFTKRIAVISASTAAGYGDFCRQLEDNEYGFRFNVTLYAATMQGKNVEQSIIAALNNIYEQIDLFDVVVIIRGGGATSDLSGFDTLALAENVAQFPLPVITGIGHERDESILDMVANRHVKTPTAAATLLIDHQKHVADRIADARQRIPVLAMRVISDSRHHFEQLKSKLPIAIERRLTMQRHRLESIAIQLQGYNPVQLLRRGYSITLMNGCAVRDTSQLHSGDEIETILEKGKFKSIVK